MFRDSYPTVDEQLQVAGSESFNKFEKRIDNLDKELRNFANAARQLGSSVGILSSAFRLRERLTKLLFLFRENAATLFPGKISRQPREMLVYPNLMDRRRTWRGQQPPLEHMNDETIDPESFPSQFASFAEDVVTFLNCLNEFPEFTDEAVNTSMRAFGVDMKYWASCLQEYKGQFRYPAVQRYIHDLTSEIGEHIDNITVNLSMLTEIGVPTIRFAQQHATSTVATLFSAVTRVFFQDVHRPSILCGDTPMDFTSHISGTLGLGDSCESGSFGVVYRRTIQSSKGTMEVAVKVFKIDPRREIERINKAINREIKVWLRLRHPTIVPLLGTANVDSPFLALVSQWMPSGTLYIYLKEATTLTASARDGLAKGVADGLNYLHSENIVHGDLHPANVLIDGSGNPRLTDFGLATVVGDTELQLSTTTATRILDSRWRAPEVIGIEHDPERSTFKSDIYSFGGVMFFIISGNIPWKEKKHSHQITIELSKRAIHGRPHSIRDDQWNLIQKCWSWNPGDRPEAAATMNAISTYTERPNSMEGHPSEESDASRRAIARQRFKGAVRSVIMIQRQEAGHPHPYLRPFMPPRTPSFDMNSSAGMSPTRFSSIGLSTIRGPRVSTLVSKLKTLEPLQDLSVHTALVRHLQFSPNGKYLATSSWDRSSVIFRVGESFSTQAVLVHVRGFIGQVAWSASGTILLTRLTRGIKVWTEDGLCKKTIDRPCSVSSIAWLPASETQFFSVEGSEVFKLDVQGRVLDSYHFGRIQLHNVAVTPDGQRLLGVGPLLAAPNGLHPSRTTRVEKRITVFNIETRQFENQTPVVNDVRDITISKRGGNVLISFEGKIPPQLWKMELVRDARDREHPYTQIARLLLRHTYLPTAHVDFAGPSCFGGKDDQLVLCAGKAGDIHIWDRDTAALLHYIRPQTLGGDLTCVAWNHSNDDPFMFATGSHDGTVRVWMTPAEDR